MGSVSMCTLGISKNWTGGRKQADQTCWRAEKSELVVQDANISLRRPLGVVSSGREIPRL